MAHQPLTKKDIKRLKQINQEIGTLTNEAVDILAPNGGAEAGFLYLSTLDFDGVDGSAMGGTQMIADMLTTIGRDQSSLHGAILLAALRLSKEATLIPAAPMGKHSRD